MYVFHLIDSYAAGYSILFLGIVEVVVIGWLYGMSLIIVIIIYLFKVGMIRIPKKLIKANDLREKILSRHQTLLLIPLFIDNIP